MHFVAAYSPMILQKVRRFLSVALSTQPTNTNLSNFLADPSIHMVEKARIRRSRSTGIAVLLSKMA